MQKVFRVKEQYSWGTLKVLLGLMVIVFTIDRIGLAWFGNDFLRRYLLLSSEGLGEGNVWQLVSYIFMHEDIGHIFCNGLVLFFIGRLIEMRDGGRRLLELFFISGVVGALVWLSVNFNRPFVVLLGASAGCLGIFSYFCMVCENRPMVFLLFFVIPIRIRPRMLLMITAGLEAFCFFTQELVGSNVANSAHLGGILGGLGCYYFYRYRHRYAKVIEEKLTKRGRMVDAVADDSYKLYVKSYSAQRSEIDRILDKINERGFKSLTEAEKNTLNSAKHLMHR
ncbi:MAG: rhomboid family intramembrane serine protease [Puniceicoccales bacterium]|jgi:membrane associated rhomboid family serine protease|nr:rhomboid family intramembrane serine protease [Puniceicoccales bacterium]